MYVCRSLMAILAGLNTSAVHRMNRHWDSLPKKKLKLWDVSDVVVLCTWTSCQYCVSDIVCVCVCVCVLGFEWFDEFRQQFQIVSSSIGWSESAGTAIRWRTSHWFVFQRRCKVNCFSLLYVFRRFFTFLFFIFIVLIWLKIKSIIVKENWFTNQLNTFNVFKVCFSFSCETKKTIIISFSCTLSIW